MMRWPSEPLSRLRPSPSSTLSSIPHKLHLRFFQDRRVKVSLFLAEGIQLGSGRLVIPGCLGDDVGIVRSYRDSGALAHEHKLSLASQTLQEQGCRDADPVCLLSTLFMPPTLPQTGCWS